MEETGAGERVSETAKIMRAAGILSMATLASRFLGLLRDAVNAAMFGLGGGMDAFLVAFRLPNMLRALLADGTLAVSFIPVFVELSEKEGSRRSDKLGRIALTFLVFVLAGVVLAGVLFAPAIVGLVALGFTRDPAKFGLTVELTRIVFPFIGLVAITALLGGMLNGRGVFLAPALAPLALNVAIIGAALILAPLFDPPIKAIAWGVLIGGAAQLALQLGPTAKSGFRMRPDFDWKDPALKKVLLLMGPSVFGVAVYHVNVVISTFLASWLPDGSISYLYYAERIFQLPLGLFAVSVGVASLPSMARLAAREEWDVFRDTFADSVRLIFFIVLPAAVGIFALAEPIVLLLFKRGLFTSEMASNTALALKCYVFALLPVAGARVAAQSFYAMKDTKTPVKGAALALLVNIAASLILMAPLKHAGLALATAVSSWVNAIYLYWAFARRMGRIPWGRKGGLAVKALFSSLIMGSAVYFGNVLTGGWADEGTGALAVRVGFSIAVGVVAYGTLTYAMNVYETRRFLGLAARKLRLVKA